MKSMNMFFGLFRDTQIPQKPEPPKPQGPTKNLVIIGEQLKNLRTPSDIVTFRTAYWNFFTTDYGKPIGCRMDPIHVETRPKNPAKNGLLYPNGEIPLQVFGEKCTYKNSGDNEGKLWCGSRGITCVYSPNNNPPTPGRPDNFYTCKADWVRQQVIECPM
jgi:hypothetical protein